jgi:ferritin-like metal-binding protein YciE
VIPDGANHLFRKAFQVLEEAWVQSYGLLSTVARQVGADERLEARREKL